MAAHDHFLLVIELLLDDEASPVGLNHQSCIILDSSLLPHEVCPGHEPLNRRLDLDETTSHSSISEPCSETAEDSLDVDGKVMTCNFEHCISIPSLRWVNDKQVLNDEFKTVVTH